MRSFALKKAKEEVETENFRLRDTKTVLVFERSECQTTVVAPFFNTVPEVPTLKLLTIPVLDCASVTLSRARRGAF